MTLLQISQRGALVSNVLQVFLKELKPSPVLLNNLTPRFDPYR